MHAANIVPLSTQWGRDVHHRVSRLSCGVRARTGSSFIASVAPGPWSQPKEPLHWIQSGQWGRPGALLDPPENYGDW